MNDQSTLLGDASTVLDEGWRQDDDLLTGVPTTTSTAHMYDFDQEFGGAYEAALTMSADDWTAMAEGSFDDFDDGRLKANQCIPQTLEDTVLSSIERTNQYFTDDTTHESSQGASQIGRESDPRNHSVEPNPHFVFDGDRLPLEIQRIQPSSLHTTNRNIEAFADMSILRDAPGLTPFSPVTNQILSTQHLNPSSSDVPVSDSTGLLMLLIKISEEDLEDFLQKVRVCDPGNLPRNLTTKLRRLTQAFKPSRVTKPRRSRPASLLSPSPTAPARNTTPRWWARFLNLTPEELVLSMEVRLMIMTPAHKFLDLRFDVGASISTQYDTSDTAYLSSCITNMRAMKKASAHLTILSHAHCLFLYIYSFGSLSNWKSTCTQTTIKRLRNDRVALLYDSLRLPITQQEFKEELREWRHIGSCLAFFAQRLGLGSIVLLNAQLADMKMKSGCTKGNESVCDKEPWGGLKPSEKAFQHLQSIGVGTEVVHGQAEAEMFMHNLLRDLFKGVPKFFEGRLETNKCGVFFNYVCQLKY